jgi:hypothetical protein
MPGDTLFNNPQAVKPFSALRLKQSQKKCAFAKPCQSSFRVDARRN